MLLRSPHAGALLVLVATLAGCATVTPVAPAPISPEEAPKLQAALLGTCQVTATQKPGGEMKNAKGIHWTFGDAGKWHFHVVTPLGSMDSDFDYRLEGRNIFSERGAFKTMRVDEYDGKTLKLFLYDITETYYCSKE